MSIKIDVSPGELMDKISILEIKAQRMNDSRQVANVLHELELLNQAALFLNSESQELRVLRDELKQVNQELWEIEDAIREYERHGCFGEQFINLARSVYKKNDRRAFLKRKITERLGSKVIEEKSYSTYP